ncbi:MAG TPA: ABC transporter permease [Gemmatimonadaceae bacterium]|nr:ABC transporter permease [Gemmatimonadaceae bacterium]
MFGRRSQRDFEDEIRSHIELETERLKAKGMSDDDARHAARRHFGNVTMAEDRFYHGRRFVALDEIGRDMRHALRGLKRTPGFLATTVITLTLGIGAVAAMFGVVNTVMLRPLPFAAPDRLFALDGTAPGSDLPERFGLGNEFYIHYKENSKLIDGIFNFGGGTSTLRVGDRVERIPMAWPANDMYATLGVKPILGRLPRAEDRDDAFVISERLWTSWFNRDSSILGKWYFVSDSMKQMVGIMPAAFKFPRDETMLWVATAEIRAADVTPGNFSTPTVVRLKPGVTPEQAAVEFRQLATQLPARFGAPPAFVKVIDRFRPVMTPMLDAALGPVVKASLLILFGAVAVVLLVACANVANLFMVRAETRRRDFTVRRAIGASRAQLVRFQLAESLVVALIAGVGAVALVAMLPAFLRAAPEGIPRLGEVRLDLPTLAATFLLVVVVSMICGIVPALRSSAPDLGGLRAGSRSNVGGRHWGRDVLVVAQTALALVLLIGSALLVQSFERLRNVDPGYDVRDTYTFQFAPQQPNLRDGPSLGQMHLMMMDRIRALPGVSTVGVVNNIPLDEGTGSMRVYPEGMSTAGAGIPLSFNFTGGDYFKAIGMRVLQGRAFTSDEAYTPNTSVILSRSAAEKLWPGQSAVGRRLRPRFGGQDTLTFTVVGVVNDVKQNDWRDANESVMYLPLTGPTARSWSMGSPAYVVKSSRAEALRPEIRRLVKEVAPEAPVYREFTMEFLARRSMLLLSFTALTLGVLSALALILGAVGLYGVLSYVVAQRTREIGVRMALGATARAVRRQVVSQGTKVVLVGAAIGLLAAYMTTRYLATLLYDVKPVDPVAFAATSAVMIAMGVLASYMPARRASSVDPMEALRSD